MDRNGNGIRVAMVGCGAIAHSHIRAVAALPQVRCTVVCDVDAARAERFRQRHCAHAAVADLAKITGEQADLAIVAVPVAAHAPVTRQLLANGLHVLCEKPLAATPDEAISMIAEAERSRRVLVCGLVRRHFGSTTLVSDALRRGLVGDPIGFQVRESVWSWPLGRAAFEPSTAGGGVLIDLGPHVLDLLGHWLGAIEILGYEDDAAGGVEAVARIDVRCHAASGPISGQVHLSRAWRTVNRTRILGTRGHIDVDPHRRHQIDVVFDEGAGSLTAQMSSSGPDPFVEQLRAVARVIEGQPAPVVTASEALKAVEAVESCYRQRKPLVRAWAVGPIQNARPWPTFRKVLVTGASGAVGSRLVEMWAEAGRLDQLRCMVRSYRSAARIMRYPVEVVEADLHDRGSVRRAAEGCDAIVHLGVGVYAGRETRALLDVAVAQGIARFVHMSSAAVYGRALPARVEELQAETRVVKTGEPYADEKAKAERAALAAGRRGLPTVVLRPHLVYGPGLRWSAEVPELLARGELPVVEHGGWCNLIYVDDLVESVLCGLVTETGLATPLFITDGEPLRWGEYIGAYADRLGVTPPRLSRSDVGGAVRTVGRFLRDSVRPLVPVLRSREFRAFVLQSPAMQATVLPAYLALRESPLVRSRLDSLRDSAPAGEGAALASPRHNELWTALQLSEARLDPRRAEAAIGFRARVHFHEGMARTADWLASCGLLPDH